MSIALTPHSKSGHLPIPKHLITLPVSSTPPTGPSVPLQPLTLPFLGGPTEPPPHALISCMFSPPCCPNSRAGGRVCCGVLELCPSCPGHMCQLAASSHSADAKAEFLLLCCSKSTDLSLCLLLYLPAFCNLGRTQLSGDFRPIWLKQV